MSGALRMAERKKARWAETTQAELFILTCTCKNGQSVNEETAAIIVCFNLPKRKANRKKVVGIARFYFDFLMTYIRPGMLCSHRELVVPLAGALLYLDVYIHRIMLYVTTDPDDNNEPQDNLQRDDVFLSESIPFKGCLVEWKGMERKE
ncbi:hypothetical protein Tco_0678973 [Tanacetum coccineum]|uniref:Uncharacterized protein n=1 Tax=Tanacetum coccineum TaxID=301880 RepID=A0ABQ4XGS2_9ASTR